MSVKLICGPWDAGTTSQRARQQAHVTRELIQPPNTQETVSKRLVDRLTAQYYFADDQDDQSVLSDAVLGEGEGEGEGGVRDDPVELRSILNACRGQRFGVGVGKTSSKELQNLQKKVTAELGLPDWQCSLVDWGLLPTRKYQLKPSVCSGSKRSKTPNTSSKSESSDKTTPKPRPRPKSENARPSSQISTKPTGDNTHDTVKKTRDIESSAKDVGLTDDNDLQLPEVKPRDFYDVLVRASSQYLIQKRHSATRVRLLENTHEHSGIVAPVGSLVLKESRRYRRPYHASANLPITVSKPLYQSAAPSATRSRSESTASRPGSTASSVVLLQQYQPTKVYTPVERALQRKSASYACHVRRTKNKELALCKSQSFQLQKSPKRPASLPRLPGRSVTWAMGSPGKTNAGKHERSETEEGKS